ncbi:MAG TPA: ribbon-helix-helix domain-containing protein [Fimbriimonas sp.]|nr:ribbon-helix-helix domain-containing protein [Fimbriimonas sp.]
MMQRTTFSMTPDVAKAIKERAKKEKRSISSVVNEALRLGLGLAKSDKPVREPFKVVPFHLGLHKEIDPTTLNERAWSDELDQP